MKNEFNSETATSQKPEKAEISDAEFRRRLKNISERRKKHFPEWIKKNFPEWRKEHLGKPHTKNPSGSLPPSTS
jgi:hypothetical protein